MPNPKGINQYTGKSGAGKKKSGYTPTGTSMHMDSTQRKAYVTKMGQRYGTNSNEYRTAKGKFGK